MLQDTIIVDTFPIVHPGKPEAGEARCDEAAWPGFSALGWVRKDESRIEGAPEPEFSGRGRRRKAGEV